VPHVKTSIAVFIAVVLGCPLVAGAEEAKPQMFPTVKAVPEIDFAKHPPLGRPVMSPDGEHIALSVHNTENGDDRYQLAVLHLPDLKFISRLDMTPKYLPTNITWVDNKRLVLSTAKEIGQLAAPVGTGDVIAVDYDGKNKRLLYSDSSRSSISSMATLLKMPLGFAEIGGTPDVPNGHFYLTVNPYPERGGADAEAHRTLMFDVNAANASVTQIAEINKDGFDFLVDHAGVVRYAYGQLNNLQEVAYYRAAADQPWQQLAESVIGKHFQPYQMSADDKQSGRRAERVRDQQPGWHTTQGAGVQPALQHSGRRLDPAAAHPGRRDRRGWQAGHHLSRRRQVRQGAQGAQRQVCRPLRRHSRDKS
jgi:hypothetical protein